MYSASEVAAAWVFLSMSFQAVLVPLTNPSWFRASQFSLSPP